MDVLLFSVTAAACCLYKFVGQHAPKPVDAAGDSDCNNNNARGRGGASRPPPPPSPADRDCRSSGFNVNPLPRRVQDWIHEFPHLQSRLNFADTTTTSPTARSCTINASDTQQQQQQQPRVVGLIIDSGSSNGGPTLHAPLLLEKAVAKINQKNGASQDDYLKIVYIASDWTDTRKDYYNPVAFGLVPFTTERFSSSFRRLVQFWVNAAMEMVMGRRSRRKNDDDEKGTTTTLKLVHSVTGKVLNKESFHHILAAAAADTSNNNNHHGHKSSHAAGANPQDNWIEIM